jgi:hypothetical protein
MNEFQRAYKAALSASHAAQRRNRVRWPVPQITGVVKLPPESRDDQAESRTEEKRPRVEAQGVSSGEAISGTESTNHEMEGN